MYVNAIALSLEIDGTHLSSPRRSRHYSASFLPQPPMSSESLRGSGEGAGLLIPLSSSFPGVSEMTEGSSREGVASLILILSLISGVSGIIEGDSGEAEPLLAAYGSQGSFSILVSEYLPASRS